MKRDLTFVAGLEKAVKKKYGEEAIVNPKKYWDDDKEEDYRKQLEESIEKERLHSMHEEKVEINGVLISKKLFNRESTRKCPVCGVYSFDSRDDLYMNKFQCCFVCFDKYVDGKEERWKSGWRPKKELTDGN